MDKNKLRIVVTILITILIFASLLKIYVIPQAGIRDEVLSGGDLFMSGEAVLSESYKDQKGGFSVFDLELSNLDTAYLDLDTGEIGDNENCDIYFGMTTGSDTFPFIQSVNGAKIFYLGSEEPQLEDCAVQATNFPNSSVNPGLGNYYCVHTNQGNISIFYRRGPYKSEVNEYYSLKLTMVIWYQTWKNTE